MVGLVVGSDVVGDNGGDEVRLAVLGGSLEHTSS